MRNEVVSWPVFPQWTVTQISAWWTTKKLHQCSGTIEILDKERRDQNAPDSLHKGATACNGPGHVYKWMFKASVQYSLFFSRSQTVALTIAISSHTNHLFPYCVFKTRSFDPTADYGCNTSCWSICLTGKRERQTWSSFRNPPTNFSPEQLEGTEWNTNKFPNEKTNELLNWAGEARSQSKGNGSQVEVNAQLMTWGLNFSNYQHFLFRDHQRRSVIVGSFGEALVVSFYFLQLALIRIMGTQTKMSKSLL